MGQRRIGVAGTDPAGRMALPLQVLRRSEPRHDIERLLDLIDERGVQLLLVGIPIRADGSEGAVARDARFFAAKLQDARLDLQVEFVDEAYTTVEAEDRLRERGLDARGQREVVDAVAAQVLVEEWLGREERT